MISFHLPGGTEHTFAAGAGDAVVELSEEAWQDFRSERRTAFGLLYAGMLTMKHGRFEDLADAEVELRRLWDGRPVYDAAAVAALDGMDLHRTFTSADDDADMRRFLRTAGFLHIRGVFGDDEVAAMADEVERHRAVAKPDDGTSWFARDAHGNQVCCRLIYLAQRSPALAAVPHDPRLARIAALAGEGMRPTDDRLDGLAVVIKNPGMVEGLSDLPWHQDCGLGGHPTLCPALNVGIQLDASNARSGQLRFLAGSHHHSIPVDGPGPEDELPIVAIDARPGDVTAHFGHVSHEAPPPTDPSAGRRTMYVMFALDRLFQSVPAGQGYNDVLLQNPGQPAPTALA